MTRREQPAVTLFAMGMIGLGVLALVAGDFALQWQPVAPWFPARTFLAYGAAGLMVFCGAGLLLEGTAASAVRILFPYLIVWWLLKVPALVVAPGMEAVWLGASEIAVLLAGGWTLFARLGNIREDSTLSFLAGERGVRAARILFALAVIPIGLSHFVYPKPTYDLVPAWLPFRSAWGYLTGAGQMASGLGVLFGVLPQIAAWAEAIQISLYTLLVWVPAVIAAPRIRLNWTALCISWAIGAAAWAVAQNVPDTQRAPRTSSLAERQQPIKISHV